MNKKELSGYFWLKHEIAMQEKRLKALEHKLEGCRQQGTVGDTVRDYRTGKGISIKIEGIAKEEFSLPAEIALIKESIKENIEKARREMLKIEEFIQGIEEPKTREVMRSRFIDCLTWREIGEKNFIAPDYARAIIREYLKEHRKQGGSCRVGKEKKI